MMQLLMILIGITNFGQTDVLDAATANAVLEGIVVTANAITPTTRLNNHVQTLQKSFSVTNVQEKVDKAGRSSEIAYQKALKLKALASDIEFALIINSAAVSGGTATARQLKGALGFIATNVTTAASGVSASGVNETDFNANLALIWAQGGKPSHAMGGSVQKRAISAFTGNNTRFISMEKSMVEAAVDVYKSDFGNVTLHLNFVMNTAAAGKVVILGDMGLWRKAWLYKPSWEELAKTGSFRSFFIEAALTLESGNEKGAGKLTGYTV